MKQIPSIAAGLASGVALSSFDAVSRLTAWGVGRTKAAGGQLKEFGGGLTDRTAQRSDSLTRQMGFQMRRGTSALVHRDNAMRRTR
jgi:type IV secretion system protein VirB6